MAHRWRSPVKKTIPILKQNSRTLLLFSQTSYLDFLKTYFCLRRKEKTMYVFIATRHGCQQFCKQKLVVRSTKASQDLLRDFFFAKYSYIFSSFSTCFQSFALWEGNAAALLNTPAKENGLEIKMSSFENILGHLSKYSTAHPRWLT